MRGPSCRAGVATISLALRGFELQPAKQPPTSNVSRCQARFSLPMTGGAAANYDEVGRRTLGTVVGAPKVRPLRAVPCGCARVRRFGALLLSESIQLSRVGMRTAFGRDTTPLALSSHAAMPCSCHRRARTRRSPNGRYPNGTQPTLLAVRRSPAARCNRT